jgi:hypothetical protein
LRSVVGADGGVSCGRAGTLVGSQCRSSPSSVPKLFETDARGGEREWAIRLPVPSGSQGDQEAEAGSKWEWKYWEVGEDGDGDGDAQMSDGEAEEIETEKKVRQPSARSRTIKEKESKRVDRFQLI